MDVHPTKNVSIGIDPYPNGRFIHVHPIQCDQLFISRVSRLLIDQQPYQAANAHGSQRIVGQIQGLRVPEKSRWSKQGSGWPTMKQIGGVDYVIYMIDYDSLYGFSMI